jgi:hypothetical protein
MATKDETVDASYIVAACQDHAPDSDGAKASLGSLFSQRIYQLGIIRENLGLGTSENLALVPN